MKNKKSSTRMEQSLITPKFYQKEVRSARRQRKIEQFVRDPQTMTAEEKRIESRQGLLIAIFFFTVLILIAISFISVIIWGYPKW